MAGSARWRLLVDGAAGGPWNMGVDEALLATATAGGGPSLRFYGWRGPWLSLGYRQTASASHAVACRTAGVGVVRRVTGGRAVLHGQDLTYAIAASETALPAGLTASYELVARALLAALLRIGVAAEATAEPRRGDFREPAAFDCFARAAGREICVGGRKLAGSAQRRAAGALLQHGSIRLRPDPVGAQRATTLTGAGATSVAELGADPERVLGACIDAFGEVLRADLVRTALSPAERCRARERTSAPARTGAVQELGPNRQRTRAVPQGTSSEADT